VLAADLAERTAVAQLAERAGAVDVLIANAALPASGPIDDFSADEIDRALDVNLRAPIQLARALLPGMVARGNGHVVFVSSLSGKVASVGSSLYSATKFGLRGFASGLREDLHGSGVGVTVVYPGFVSDAGMFAEAGVSLPKGVGTRSPEQVAAAVVTGIERDKAEIDVAPLSLRAGTFLSSLAPVTAARLQRRLGSARLSHAIAEGQKPKR
jgi:short-subunit dehydrogenase